MNGYHDSILKFGDQKHKLRRSWSAIEKLSMVRQSYAPKTSVSAVARAHGVRVSLLFQWRKLAREGTLSTLECRDRHASQ